MIDAPERTRLYTPRQDFSVNRLVIAGNRGPCGGVNMALKAADQVLKIVDGRELVYTPWPIVHNEPVMERLKERGLRDFRMDWTIPPDESIVMLPAHGAARHLYEIAERKRMHVVDVTCQLVTRVQHLGKYAEQRGEYVIYIGVGGHPETEGVLGGLTPGRYSLIDQKRWRDDREMYLIPILAQLASLPEEAKKIVYTQTTLLPPDVTELYKQITRSVNNVAIPSRMDICPAMDNRWTSANQLVPEVDLWLVMTTARSSNGMGLLQVGIDGNKPAYHIDYPREINKDWLRGITSVGLTSAASTPEYLIGATKRWFKHRNPNIEICETPQVRRESRSLTFKLPRSQIEALKARYAD